jgi:Transposase DDE domain group 1
MRLLHELAKTHALFDDPNLVSRAGLVPLMALAQRCGLADLTAGHVRTGVPAGVSADVKVACLVAGMAAGADSIDDMDVLRHGAMAVLFGGVRAPSTLGSFLRSFTWGNARQLEKVHREFLAELACRAPLPPGKDVLAFAGIDSQQKRVFGYQKQGAGFGFTKISGKSLLVRGLNVLAAAVSTPLAAPVVAAVRLRGGSAASARGAASFITEAVGAARDTGCSGTLVVRMDSAYYSRAAIWAVRRAGACFSVTAQLNLSVKAAIAAVPPTAWTPISYPRALWDDQLGCWVSDAEVAEVKYTAFAVYGRRGQAPAPLDARLIVRRVRDMNTKAADGQAELSRPGATTPCSPTARPGRSRPRNITATTPSSSRSSPTGTTGPWLTCRRARSSPTPRGWPARPSAATCCAPPVLSPAASTPGPAAPPSAATSSTSRPAPPPRPRPPHLAPARRLAPPPGVAESLRSRLRPASHCGLTSPDQVSATEGQPAAHP